MEFVVFVALLAVVVLLLVLLFRPGPKSPNIAEKQDLESARSEMRDSLNQVRDMLQTQMGSLRGEVSNSLSGLRQDVGSRLDSTTTTIGLVQTKLGELTETTKQIQEIGKDIASLQDILQPPKLRGGLGEMLLERLLGQILPEGSYTPQYQFRDGKRVDAIINLGNGRVPVDSKFPLESFKRILESEQEEEKRQARRQFIRDVKQHVDRVAEYIRPDEGTLEFALMYVPAENVYYETIIKSDEVDDDLFSYALEKHVVPVSPYSFYAYLGAIALGLKGLAIEQSAKQVLEHLHRLESDFKGIDDEFNVLGKHLTNASNKYDDTRRRLERFSDHLTALPTNIPVPLAQPDSEK